MEFGSALSAGFQSGKRLCVGIDPHAYLLEAADLPDSASGAERFGIRLVDSAAGLALAVKPQVAFFERFGADGYAALENVFHAAREARLLLIADAKRGDVGSSFGAYAEAWLTPGAPLEADALTVSAFQGFGVLSSALELSVQSGKGLFVLVATSNPEAAPIQQAMVSPGTTVSAHLLNEILEFNRERNVAAPVANVGAVLGATLQLSAYGLPTHNSADQPDSQVIPILAPGFGHQGGQIEHVRESFGDLTRGIIVSESRSVIADGLAAAPRRIAERAEQLRAESWGFHS